MKNKLFYFINFVFLFFNLNLIFCGCSFGVHEIFGRTPDIDARSGSIKYLSLEESPNVATLEKFSFIVFTDMHFGKTGNLRKEHFLINYLSNLKQKSPEKFPVFAICLGDFADHGLESEYDDYVKFTTKLYDDFGIKTYTVAGNHDLYNSGWKIYSKKIFPYSSFYNFQTKNFSFYFIDTASGAIGNAQFNSLKNAFSHDQKKKLIFSHFPLTSEGTWYFRLQDLAERNRFVALLAQNSVALFLSGHIHKAAKKKLWTVF